MCRTQTSKKVTLDQNEYVKGIHLIPAHEFTGKDNEAYCDTHLHQMYWSILGVAAFATLTRVDIAVFISVSAPLP